MLVYLSGAIEYSPDHGRAWREPMTWLLRKLGHEVYDPGADQKKNLTDEEVRDFRGWKHTDLPRFQDTVRKIIAWDLDWVERKCDAVIVFWDEHAGRGAGTQGELTMAHRRGVPVYLVLGMPHEQVSGWILGCASRIFRSFDELGEFLRAQETLAMAAAASSSQPAEPNRGTR